MQFSSGKPPLLVKERDLAPEITYQTAHSQVADIITDYLKERLHGAPIAPWSGELWSRVNSSLHFMAPFVNSMFLEGSRHIVAPCNGSGGRESVETSCAQHCPWSEIAQDLLAEMSESAVMATDAILSSAAEMRSAKPELTKVCEKASSCHVNATIFSQLVYDVLDDADTGFTYISASEIRTKMKSRQVCIEVAGGTPEPFNVTDGLDRCAKVNREVYNRALASLPATSRSRYLSIGEYYEFSNDTDVTSSGENAWLNTELKVTRGKNQTGAETLFLSSPTFRTLDSGSGMHYCKLLSPARAMEWMMVDGLRLRGSLNNKTHTHV